MRDRPSRTLPWLTAEGLDEGLNRGERPLRRLAIPAEYCFFIKLTSSGAGADVSGSAIWTPGQRSALCF